nr:MAG TPA: hypothetical protein [Caudoviricetes sp.]
MFTQSSTSSTSKNYSCFNSIHLYYLISFKKLLLVIGQSNVYKCNLIFIDSLN